MKVDLKDKVALVTGAGQNIGKAIARALAANGAIVVFTDINQKNVEEAAAECPGCIGRRMDVASELGVNQVIDEIVKTYGRLDILVNNAGVNTNSRVTVDQFPVEEWHRIMDIDLNGLFYVSKAGAKIMKARKSGRIINIASIVGHTPLRNQCAFASAKAGVIQFSKAMAIELGGHGILVNAIAPGSILIEGTRKMFYGDGNNPTEAGKSMLAHIPLGRPGEVEEIANVALFLAAPESSYITGTVLTVDGGWTTGYAREF
jgi:3-oxoacyl-[acyl-carrier protein] reductase